MSTKRFAGLTVEQLNAAGAAAGTEAVASAHAVGVASSGLMKLRLASGDEVKTLTRLHPDGTLEIADNRITFDQQDGIEVLSKAESARALIGKTQFRVETFSNNSQLVIANPTKPKTGKPASLKLRSATKAKSA